MNRLDATQLEPTVACLAQRVRALRRQRRLARRTVAARARVSERHLANIESGTGNASVLLLRQIAQVLNCTLANLFIDETAVSSEWLEICELLRGRSEAELARTRAAVANLFPR